MRSRRSAPLLRAQLRASVLLSALTLSWGCSEDGEKLKLREDHPLTAQDAGQSPTGTSSPAHTPSATQKNSAPSAPSDQDSAVAPPTDSSTTSPETECGDGEEEGDEECDDGNRDDADGCDRFCNTETQTTTRCGDGEKGGREQCDDGNRDDGDGCDRFCNIESICGDSKVEGDEACDPPGSPQCNDQCQLSICGNDFTDVGEECDPPGKQCTDTCQRPCGDGTLDPESCVGQSCEECDDGNERAGDGCSTTCHPEACGNGRIDWNEECDIGLLTGEGASDPRNVCTAECLLRSYCGDGVVGGLEECDPAQPGTLPCSAECLRLPGCGDGILSAGEQCADNNRDGNDGCDTDCQGEFACGDGILTPNEQCDDGNVENADGCSKLCRAEMPPAPFTQNLIANDPDFNATAPWLAADQTIVAERSTRDVQNSPISGSLQVSLSYPETADGAVVSGAQYTCLTLTAGAEHELLALYYLDPALPASGAAAGATFLFYATGSNCTGTIVGAHTVVAADATRGVWRTLRDSFTVPEDNTGTLDVRFRLDVNADEGVSGAIYYDNIKLGIADSAAPPAARCGDGIVNQSTESCDDGNVQSGDGCAADCADEPACGDGNLDDGEACDDGNVANNDYCSTNCTPSSVCGDDLREWDEQCDGEANCTHYCALRGTCGDGDVTVEAGEACDNGTQNGKPGNDCTLRCQVTPVCGDGEVATIELCDDGNTENGDGCSEHCVIEPPPPCPEGYIRKSTGLCQLYVPPTPSSAAPVPTPLPTQSSSASASNTAPSPSVSSSVSASGSIDVLPEDAGVTP